ncbi:MAG: 5-dehydro-4-deoxy-D-glucuronate isomerase [Deltaproteobacteria bacterium]|nr:MAG: 5-dehydro-4-deoxy-D-glucuronate isomerase [Deltaproteobacteria bacterium]
MEKRDAIHPNDFEVYTTEEIREEFLVQDLFVPGNPRLVYSYYDRMIVGGICPDKALHLEVSKELGSDFFLHRREMGTINVGPRGMVAVEGEEYVLETKDGLYVGMGAKEVSFSSADKGNPARFYLISGPAHTHYPTQRIEIGTTETVHLGSPSESNERTIHKYIHPDGVKSCQLVMGMTLLAPNNVWNSMPCHTHDRRMEAYFYFDLADDAVLFHFMGKPDQTRHIVVRNEEAVLSPSWSIHSGVGTSNYTFIWAMLGENQIFTDMDDVPMSALK